MPALAPVPNVIKVTTHYTLDEDVTAQNRFFLHYSGSPPSVTQLSDYASYLDTKFAADLQPNMSQHAVLTGIDVIDLSSDTGNSAFLTVSRTGGESGIHVPAEASLVISFFVARRWRGGHSRIYWPGMVENQMQDEQTWTEAAVTAIGAAWESFLTDMTGFTEGGWSPDYQVVVSYFHGHTNVLYPSGYYHAIPTARPEPLVSAVIGVRFNRYIGTQRRRNLYVSGS